MWVDSDAINVWFSSDSLASDREVRNVWNIVLTAMVEGIYTCKGKTGSGA